MIHRLFYFFSILIAVAFGYWKGSSFDRENTPLHSSHGTQFSKSFPVVEDKSFAIIVYAYKEAAHCERVLRSILQQNYDRFRILFFDDGSKDSTEQKVQSFVLENKQDHRLIFMQNEKRLGPVACLYRAMEHLSDREIVIPINARDWFAHPNTLEYLNCAFQNPDIWLAACSPILYPTFNKVELASYHERPSSIEQISIIDPSEFSRRLTSKFRAAHSTHSTYAPTIPVAFYANLFKQVRLSGMLQEGQFVTNRDSYLIPMLQIAQKHHCVLNEPTFISDLSRTHQKEFFQLIEPSIRSKPVEKKADFVLFSANRPMQLFSCLESIHHYISGYEQIFVLCRADHERYAASYRKVWQAFPDVHFVFQSATYKKDFKPLLLNLLSNPSPYVIFGVDDQIVKDYADLQGCMEMMEKTEAYGFYLRLGKHICFSYQSGQNQSIPPSVQLSDGVYAWNLRNGPSDWNFPHTLDMTLYRKSSLMEAFKKMQYKTPNSLEYCWANEASIDHEIGLYFETSKVVNIPLNVIGRTGNPHTNFLSPEEMLCRFEEGLKIDIQPFYRIENPSPHMAYEPALILR